MWALVISFFRLARFQGSVQAAACISLSFLFVAIRRAANFRRQTFGSCPPGGHYEKVCAEFSSPCFRVLSMSPGCVPGTEWRPMECTACHSSGWPGRSTVSAMFYLLASFSHPHRHCLTMSLGTATPVCYLFLIVVLVCISLMTEWTVAMFLFLIGCCVFSLEGCDLQTIAHF